MRWVHFSDSVDFSKIKWSDLNQYVFHFLVVLSIIWQIGSDIVMVNLIATYFADSVKLEFFVNLSCY